MANILASDSNSNQLAPSSAWSSRGWNAQADDILAAKPEQYHTIPCDGLFKKGGALDSVVPDDFDHSRVECGLFTVPLDWARPYKHKRTQLHYVKYRAASDAVREGTIFVSLPYRPTSLKLGPAFVQDLQVVSTAPKLHNGTGGRFDLVFWTPRGYPGRASITTNGTRFYVQASRELGIERAPWGDRMEYLQAQTAADAENWLLLQSKMLERCIARQRATECSDTVLRYVGTAATVRDMVGMADAFDGPESAVHFWGTESGARIGAHLLRSRVILEAPQDLEDYLYGDLYEAWKKELHHAQETLSEFVASCVEDAEQDCSRYIDDDEVLDDDRLGQMELVMFSCSHTYRSHSLALSAQAVRTKYMGWRNALGVDLDNPRLALAFKAPTMFGNASFDAITVLNALQHIAVLNTLQHVEHIDGLDLGMMPVYCGDHASEYSPESAAKRAREIAEMLEDDMHLAPLFSADFAHFTYQPHPLAAAPLVIQYAAHPLAPRAPLSHVVPGTHWDVAHDFVQMPLGLPSYDHKTCLSDVIDDYLREGKLPERSVCYDDPELDGTVGVTPTGTSTSAVQAQVQATSETALLGAWRKFEFELRSAYDGGLGYELAIVPLALAAVVVLAVVALRKRTNSGGRVRGRVRLEGEDTQAAATGRVGPLVESGSEKS
ncbi:hypothetical protein C8Q70DRAFT_930090 [Cubamyces menziesii]|nr:hypothetical protein C8Q70DRAFT_930090 [Cubamyces menziesii]